MKLRKLMSVAVALAAVVTTAQAQAPAKPFTFGVSLGGSLPTGDFGKGVKTGFVVGGLLETAPAALPVKLRFNLDYNQHSFKGGSGSIKNISGTANAVYDFPSQSSFRPYVIGGVGAYHGRAGGESDTNFGLNGGAGINIPLSGFSTFVEARYNHIFVSGGSQSYIPVVFGVRF